MVSLGSIEIKSICIGRLFSRFKSLASGTHTKQTASIVIKGTDKQANPTVRQAI